MRVWTASLMLRLRLADGSPRLRRALEAVLRAADAQRSAGLRAMARALRRHGPEAVWRAWLNPAVSGPSPERWASPLLRRPPVPPPAAGEPPTGPAPLPDFLVNAAWQEWLHEHHPTLWSLLAHWDRPSTDADPRQRLLSRLALGHPGVTLDSPLLAGTALRFDHPVGEPARERLLTLADAEAVELFCAGAHASRAAVAFCAAHHLAPSDEVRRAVFFVRTGQREQYRAQDPDGALLALGYRGAGAQERPALRGAMTAMGDLDTLRVLAGQRTERDFASLTRQERAFLVRQLTGRQDWPGLWRLVPLMPLAEAVTATRAFGQWRPPDEEGRELFAALRDADPATVRYGLGALSTLPPALEPETVAVGARLEAGFTLHDLDFSPDGRQLAFVGSVGRRSWAGTVDFGTRKVTVLHSAFPFRVTRVAHLGAETVVVAEDYSNQNRSAPTDAKKLHLLDGGGAMELSFEAAHYLGLERIAGDRAFAAVVQGAPAARGTEYGLFTGAGPAPVTDTGALRRTGRFFPWTTTVDPSGCRVAVLGPLHAVITDLPGGTVNELDPGPEKRVIGPLLGALSPTALARINSAGHLDVWYEPLTTRQPPRTSRAWTKDTVPAALAWSPELNRFLAVTGTHAELLSVPPHADGPVPEDLVSQRTELEGGVARAACVRLSPGGDRLAVARSHGTIDVYDLAPRPSAIIAPMGLMGREDLAELTALGGKQELGPSFHKALRLLFACLEHRFRYDIGIGAAAGARGASDLDIALGGVQDARPGPGQGEG
ncbi:hypothetical protein [Streptomyces sp. TS71-3]|uniref:hypothetical protein n=1 Tax=Streptomyces sp. TS71-3 TaxID=2733862 RepID=UPI001AFFB0BC|nr:hypothetical protein [Streptomyces sp. TS71-3]GHJ38676.1 hypothetical protein Sm713_42850 [Streptomyces sp. TS71-3]